MTIESKEGLNNILQAIKNYIDPVLEKLRYDKTYKGKIISYEGSGIYNVQINGKLYNITTNTEDLVIGSVVRIKAPLNNFSDMYLELSSSGGSGTNDYLVLSNKPSINSVILSGDKTLSQLGIQPEGDYIEDINYVHTDNNFDNTYKTKLDGIATGAEVNVNADWNSVSGDSLILNKPTNLSQFTQDLDTDDIPETVNNRYVPIAPVANPDIKYLNGNNDFVEITTGSGGYASNLYPTNIDSGVLGYKKLSYTNDLTETIKTNTITNQELLFRNYIFDLGIGVTSIDAGIWSSQYYYKISSPAGVTQLKIEFFIRHVDNSETTLFSGYSQILTVSNEYQMIKVDSIQPQYTCLSTDRLGLRIYGKTTSVASVTISTIVGGTNAAFFNTPLALRHNQLRGKNDEEAYQHISLNDVARLSNTSGTNTGDETTSTIKTKLGVANTSTDGYLTSTDWNTFNNKQELLVSTTNIKTINGETVLGSGNIIISGGISVIDNLISTNVEAALSANQGRVLKGLVDTKAPSDSATFTGIIALPSTTSIGNVSDTEISYLDGVTSSIQTQINGKASKLDCYPVGAYYHSNVSTSPATLFGGTWVQITDRSLIGAGSTYVNGTNYGASTHTHDNGTYQANIEMFSVSGNIYLDWQNVSNASYTADGRLNTTNGGATYTSLSESQTQGIKVGGTSSSASSLGPVRGAYIWYRSA